MDTWTVNKLEQMGIDPTQHVRNAAMTTESTTATGRDRADKPTAG